MFDPGIGNIVKLDYEFTFSPSGGGLFHVQQEEAHRCYVVGVGYSPRGGFSSPAVALITLWGIVQTIFGYPGEDAYWKDPRGSVGSICEIVGSNWKDTLKEYNRRVFGPPRPGQMDPDQFLEPPSLPPLRHFFLGSKDVSAQFLARDLLVEVYSDIAFDEVVQDSLRRLHTQTAPPWDW